MTIGNPKLRAVNAFEDGSCLEVHDADGTTRHLLVDVDREIRCMGEPQNGVVPIGLSRSPGQVVLFDTQAGRTVASQNIWAQPKSFAGETNNADLTVAMEIGFTRLTGSNLTPAWSFIMAEHLAQDRWRLLADSAVDEATLRQLRKNRLPNTFVGIRPNQCRMMPDGRTRNVTSSQRALEKIDGHFSTFVTEVAVEDFDFSIGEMTRRVLTLRYSDEQEVPDQELISVSPCGTKALLRHHRLPEKTGARTPQGLGTKLGRSLGLAGNRPPPPGPGIARVELWDLNAGQIDQVMDVAEYDHRELADNFLKLNPAKVGFKVPDPVDPHKIGSGPKTMSRDTSWGRLMTMPCVAGWTETGVIVLLADRRWREIRFDGTAGPYMMMDDWPKLGPNEVLTNGLLNELDVTMLANRVLRAENRHAAFEIDVPPFAPVPEGFAETCQSPAAFHTMPNRSMMTSISSARSGPKHGTVPEHHAPGAIRQTHRHKHKTGAQVLVV